ncbi:MAG TPA: hypothetical protein VMT12_04860, partial [Syntrophales bacterium]|nr:hypothetical protein [Syntrophales bacterium]
MSLFKNWYSRPIGYLKKWKIYIGVAVSRVPPYSIVFFPLMPDVICCGFAGILTIKGGEKKEGRDLVEKFIGLFGEIKNKGMRALLSGAITPAQSLGGNQYLRDMEKAILELKTDTAFQDIFFNHRNTGLLSDLTKEMKVFFGDEEKCLEENAGNFSTGDMETINSRHILMKDIIWGLEKDILDNIGRIIKLTGAGGVNEISPEMFKKYKKINFLLNCIDRLEVRGRDSAGIQISLAFPDGAIFERVLKVLKEKGLYEDFSKRIRACDLQNGSICLSYGTQPSDKLQGKGTALSFVYKTSSIIGELGQNVRDLRKFISADRIFHEFAGQETDFETFISHTRWASVGSITDDNCHPVNNFTLDRNTALQGATWPEIKKTYPFYGEGNWFISVVLNGDIDNYQSLRMNLEKVEDLIAP